MPIYEYDYKYGFDYNFDYGYEYEYEHMVYENMERVTRVTGERL